MKSHAQAVIIGGGVYGCSIAYHLTAMGWRDVVLVEKGGLTGGATFHAAGLVGQLRGSVTLTRMIMYSVELYRRLGAETGHEPDWRETGSLRLASTPERMLELKRHAATARTFGLPMELLTPKEAVELFPVMSDRGLLGAAYLPTDGSVDPSGLTFAFAKGARNQGAEICTETEVTGITVRDGRVRAVTTTRGTIRTDVVVNCAGIWAAHIGAMAGVTVPVVGIEHQYLLTGPIEGTHPRMPVVRDPDLLIYFREEVRGLCIGWYEASPIPFGLDGIPADFHHRLLAPNWDKFEQVAKNIAARLPAVERAGVHKLINGPDGFTPDGDLVLGEAPGVRGFFVAGGSPGIACAGGVGKVMAEWIIEGAPGVDLWRMDIRRFQPHYADRAYAAARALETYEKNYWLHPPFEERESARGLKVSPPYPRLAAMGAVFGEKGGWERPNWFSSNEPAAAAGNPHNPAPAATRGAGPGERVAVGPLDWTPLGWARLNWSPAIGVEHRAVREAAGLFDFTSFSKFEVEGPGALRVLQWLTDNQMDRPPGSVTYTQMLNARGGIECDLTVTRLGPEQFMVITGSAFGVHDLDWIRRHLPDDGSVAIRDVTAERCCIGLWGPKARQILQQVCDDDVSNAAFPYMTCREIRVAGVPVHAQRVTYVGELGWEFYVPMASGLTVWDALWEAGRPLGLRPVGYRAVDSLRLEKGYRYWSVDITPEYTPFESGQAFCVKLDKGDFQGREALVRQKAEGIRQRLCCLVLADPQRVALGNEPVLDGDRVVGRVTSGGYGYTVGESIAYAYLPADLAGVGTALAVVVDGERFGATVQREPRYDPTNSRVKA
ncbi:MAG: FAD-dependent oxidoreductase [Armatimonadota bacterium]|nr:FAD-dependent oxidoreductase [Armatimonadota bacterium]MDR7548797.1 FAD-dependent oxidoreductase [Armatimonadota bacterium]